MAVLEKKQKLLDSEQELLDKEETLAEWTSKLMQQEKEVSTDMDVFLVCNRWRY